MAILRRSLLIKVSQYFLVALIVLLVNLAPVLGPPTWTILVFCAINYSLNNFLIVIIAVAMAVTGRAILALSFRKYSHLLPKRYLSNLQHLGVRISNDPKRRIGALLLFLISPISSAQLFETAGIMRSIKLKPLLAAFAFGRLISYSIYIASAHLAKDSSIGAIVIGSVTSPAGIAIQLLTLAVFIVIGNINWADRK